MIVEGVSDDLDLWDLESGMRSTDCCTESGFKCTTIQQHFVVMFKPLMGASDDARHCLLRWLPVLARESL